MSESVIVDAAIVVPWRTATGREQSFELAWKYNNPEFADFKIYFSDSVGDKFNVSEARNRGCIQAIEDGYKFLVVMDADTIFERNAVVDALKVVSEEDVISYIYTWSLELNGWTCDALSDGRIQFSEVSDFASKTEGHVGSGWAMTSEMFWQMNGWDENFQAWGYEDIAFQKAYELISNNPMLRVPGNCYRLWHPDRDTSGLTGNMERFELYYNNPEITREDLRSVLKRNMVHRVE
jgi:hypothetical protein